MFYRHLLFVLVIKTEANLSGIQMVKMCPLAEGPLLTRLLNRCRCIYQMVGQATRCNQYSNTVSI